MKSTVDIRWDVPIPKPTRDIEQLRRDLDMAGYCLVAEALNVGQIERLLERIQEQARVEEKLLGVAHDPVFTSVDNLLNKGALFQDLLLHPVVSELLAHLLGPDYLLSLFEARGVGPGHGAQALHSDQNIIPGRTPVPFIANALWMLVDFTEENGCTRVLPGSHLWPEHHPVIQRDMSTWATFEGMFNDLYDHGAAGASQLRRGARGMLPANPPGSVGALAPAGSVLVFNAKLIHGAGHNSTSDQVRWTILSYFCRPFMRQLTNPFLSLSEEVVRSLSPELRRRVGYRPWAHMGRYEDCLAWGNEAYLPGSGARTGELRLEPLQDNQPLRGRR